jgi:hypothetical protein
MKTNAQVLVSLLACIAASLLSDVATAQIPIVPEYRGQKQLNVIAICYFEDFQEKGRTISLEYVTQVNIRDRKALLKEVDEVWRQFRPEAERLHAKRALINPNSAKAGGISTAFVFEADDQGRWRRTTNGDPPRK